MPLLKRLGTLGKGFGTIAGAVLGVGGLGTAVATGTSDTLVLCATELLKQPEGIVIGLGAIITLFGVGRKAGWAAKP